MASLACSHCHLPFSSRNALFRHLRLDCDPAAPAPPPNANAKGGPSPRLVLLLRYTGHAFLGGFVRNAAANEGTRPTVEAALVGAVRQVWGPDSVKSFTQAVVTEKYESAQRNVVVLAMQIPPSSWAAGVGAEEEAALRAALPPDVALLAPPRLMLPSKNSLAGIARGVVRRTHGVAVPYSALLRRAGGATARGTGGGAGAGDAAGAGGSAGGSAGGGAGGGAGAGDGGGGGHGGVALQSLPERERLVRDLSAQGGGACPALFLVGFPGDSSVAGLGELLDAAGVEGGMASDVDITIRGGWSTLVLKGAAAGSSSLGATGGAEVGTEISNCPARTMPGTNVAAGSTQTDTGAAVGWSVIERMRTLLDGQVWRGCRLTALPWPEAQVKLEVHGRIKRALGVLRKGRDFHNFTKESRPGPTITTNGSSGTSGTSGTSGSSGTDVGGSAGGKATAQAKAKTKTTGPRTVLHCASGFHRDLRPRPSDGGERKAGSVCGDGDEQGGGDSWIDSDWCVILFRCVSAKIRPQQLRRMAGAVVAVVRGCETSEWLERCLGPGFVATPPVPAEALWLDTFDLDPGTAAIDPEVAAFAGGHDTHTTNGALSSVITAAVRAASAEPWRVFVEALDSGVATRSVGDALLRSLAQTGDAAAIERGLPRVSSGGSGGSGGGGGNCGGEPIAVSSIDARDEYGRTALFVAASRGHAGAVDALLARGARPDATAHGGCLAARAAALGGFRDVAGRLRSAVAELPEWCPDHLKQASLPAPLWRSAIMGEVEVRAGAQVEAGATAEAGDNGVTVLIPLNDGTHPGAGSLIVDQAVPREAAEALRELWRTIPAAPKVKATYTGSDRSYYADTDGWLSSLITKAAARAHEALAEATFFRARAAGGRERGDDVQGCGEAVEAVEAVDATTRSLRPPHLSPAQCVVAPLVRFLNYPSEGGYLEAHVDLSRMVTLPHSHQEKGGIDDEEEGDEEGSRLGEEFEGLAVVADPEEKVEMCKTGETGETGKTDEKDKKEEEASPMDLIELGTAVAAASAALSTPALEPCSVSHAPADTTVSVPTTHSFLLYLTDCDEGGETVLHETCPGDEDLRRFGGVAPGPRGVVSKVKPRSGRLFLMPHACPHSAAPVVDTPKLLIRGEMILTGGCWDGEGAGGAVVGDGVRWYGND